MARRLRTTSLDADTICEQLGMDIIGLSETGQIRKWGPHFRKYMYLGHPDDDNPHHKCMVFNKIVKWGKKHF